MFTISKKLKKICTKNQTLCLCYAEVNATSIQMSLHSLASSSHETQHNGSAEVTALYTFDASPGVEAIV